MCLKDVLYIKSSRRAFACFFFFFFILSSGLEILCHSFLWLQVSVCTTRSFCISQRKKEKVENVFTDPAGAVAGVLSGGSPPAPWWVEYI